MSQCDQTIYFDLIKVPSTNLALKKHFRDMTNPHSIKRRDQKLSPMYLKKKISKREVHSSLKQFNKLYEPVSNPLYKSY